MGDVNNLSEGGAPESGAGQKSGTFVDARFQINSIIKNKENKYIICR